MGLVHHPLAALVFANGVGATRLDDDDARVVAAGARAIGPGATFDLLELLFSQVSNNFFAEVQLVGENYFFHLEGG